MDDGYSGTNFDRPGFQKMLEAVESDQVAVIITKDLSRFGHNSALTGMYINITFAKHEVRYIAINDNYDTIDPNSIDNDFAGIKNWFNEFFARDTSRKIRAVMKSKGERGEHLTANPPYGYMKEPENPKNKKQRKTPEDERTVFYNTQPAIISEEVFGKVQQIRQQRHRRTSTGKSSIFSGLVFCADCGAKMYYCTSAKFEKRQDFFVCSTHRHRKGQCSAHYIRAVVLEDMVLRHMQMVISYVSTHKAHFRAVMGERLKLASDEAIRVGKKKLTKAEKRLNELDRIFMRLYEDRVNGTISDERFATMSRTYEDEQSQLKQEVETLTKEIAQQE